MNVKDAVHKAKQYVVDLFEGEQVRNVGLEEVFLEESDGYWVVTVGFSRPWDEPASAVSAIGGAKTERTYKVVVISDGSGEVVSIRNKKSP